MFLHEEDMEGIQVETRLLLTNLHILSILTRDDAAYFKIKSIKT